MANPLLIRQFPVMKDVPLSESKKKKVERNQRLMKVKKEAIAKKKVLNRKLRHELKMRTYKYVSQYKKASEERIKNKREAKQKGIYYREADPKVLLVIRIKGINKLAPKPKKILQLFRLRQINNAVFIKINKATMNMLKVIEPFVTYGYPSLAMTKKLIYKRGYGKIGKPGAWSRVRLQNNELIRANLGKYGIEGMEDLVNQIYTCGEHFKYASNFLWPFKLNSPRKGFVAKRHGFCEPRKGDWGNRENLINQLLKRMV